MPSDSPSGPPGSVKIVEFVLCGQPFTAMSAGPLDPFNHAISFVVQCEDREELDRYWNGLLDGGVPEQCGWLKDRFGLSWQIVPAALGEWMSDPDPLRAWRTADAMMKMVKLDIGALKAAHAGPPAEAAAALGNDADPPRHSAARSRAIAGDAAVCRPRVSRRHHAGREQRGRPPAALQPCSTAGPQAF